VGKWGSNPDQKTICLALRAQLQGIFANYGVDVVLQGHDHTVSRTYPINAQGKITQENEQTVNGVKYSIDPSGVIYVMNGPAGSQTRSPHERYDRTAYYYAKSSLMCSWADFSIDGNTLTVTAQYVSGTGVSEYAKWGIQKTA
jgi:3',5'-cyclic AMP phosphodiesterase CpdA